MHLQWEKSSQVGKRGRLCLVTYRGELAAITDTRARRGSIPSTALASFRACRRVVRSSWSTLHSVSPTSKSLGTPANPLLSLDMRPYVISITKVHSTHPLLG
ncbi:hypothetical protein COCVIDRAFT_87989 [Bipolaris victoriae FI3]|uniref:Uncharacterized protein n=1 Tax=Bipolaris victoriae (strain FI3) TaxID=930091 RepID=W7ELX6_BIPV3|nr:hypothetical protein COCVIDRAFT_87989 [Bipolaris victoriae FI3]